MAWPRPNKDLLASGGDLYPLSRAQRLIAAAKTTGHRDDVTEPAAAKEEIRALCHSALARFGDTDESVFMFGTFTNDCVVCFSMELAIPRRVAVAVASAPGSSARQAIAASVVEHGTVRGR